MTLTPLVVEKKLAVIPRARGKKGRYVCVDDNCGGPTYCLHRCAPPLSDDAVLDYIKYDTALPVKRGDLSINEVHSRVLRHFHAPSHPRDMQRCGITTALLGLCGITLDQLASVTNVAAFLETYKCTWKDLQLLHFHPSMCLDQEGVPLIPLYSLRQAGFTIYRLSEYPVTIEYLYTKCDLSEDNLLFLGATRVHMIALGARSKHFSTSEPRFGMTPELHQRLLEEGT